MAGSVTFLRRFNTTQRRLVWKTVSGMSWSRLALGLDGDGNRTGSGFLAECGSVNLNNSVDAFCFLMHRGTAEEQMLRRVSFNNRITFFFGKQWNTRVLIMDETWEAPGKTQDNFVSPERHRHSKIQRCSDHRTSVLTSS